MTTVEGCPLALPLSKSHQYLLPRLLRFTTSHWQERWVVDPLLVVALGLLAWVAAGPPFHGL